MERPFVQTYLLFVTSGIELYPGEWAEACSFQISGDKG